MVSRACLAIFMVTVTRPATPWGQGLAPTVVDEARAVRDLGRLEEPARWRDVATALGAPAPAVRIAAAHAVAQTFDGARADARVAEAIAALQAALDREREPAVRGALLESLARLVPDAGLAKQLAATAAALASAARQRGASRRSERDEAERLGAARAFEILARRLPKVAWSGAALESLRRCARAEEGPERRRLCWEGLARIVDTSAPFDRGIEDADDQVRRIAVTAAAAAGRLSEKRFLKALDDPSFRVQVEALRRAPASLPAPSIARGLHLATPHARIAAAEALERRCAVPNAEIASLLEKSRSDHPGWIHDPRERDRWAILRARSACDPLSSGADIKPASDWVIAQHQVAIAGYRLDLEAMLGFTRHGHPNVVTTAMDWLSKRAVKTRGDLAGVNRARDAALRALEFATAPQVVIAAAHSLEALSPPPSDVAARSAARDGLRRALARATRPHRDTWRDVRLALVKALEALGEVVRAAPPNVDESVERDAAEAADADAMSALIAKARAEFPMDRRVQLQFQMAGAGAFTLELAPDLAPETCARVWDLARRGGYDGLTFHRYSANFVIQGGSPLAHEYAGHDPYVRDEVGGRHLRGTAGISTRGRHTGDSQIFVNLVDSPRLDTAYTVFARVVEGLETVDRVLEGDVIEHVRVIVTPRDRATLDQSPR